MRLCCLHVAGLQGQRVFDNDRHPSNVGVVVCCIQTLASMRARLMAMLHFRIYHLFAAALAGLVDD